MKKNSVLRSILLFAAIGFVLFIGSRLFFHFGIWGHRNIAAWQNGGTQMMVFHRGGFYYSFREQQFGGMQGLRHFGRAPGIFGFGSLLFAILIGAIGWILRKTAKGNMWKKWAGWLLIAIGLFMLIRRAVPLMLFIIIGMVIWKLVIKGKREYGSETMNATPSFEAYPQVSSKTGDMLDEWERKISKEVD